MARRKYGKPGTRNRPQPKGGMKSRYGYEKGGNVEMHVCKPN